MSTRPVVVILAGVALVMGTWAWVQRDVAAQQQMGPGQGMMGSGGMMGNQAPQGGTSTGPGTMGPQRGAGQGIMGAQTQQGGQGVPPEPKTGPRAVGPQRRSGATRGGWGPGRGVSLYDRPLVSGILLVQGQLGLTPQQVERLQALRVGFEKETIRRSAEIRAAEVDLSNLLEASQPDLRKIEGQIKKIAGLEAELRFARIKALEQGRAILSQVQWKKFESVAPGFGPMGPYGGRWQQGQFGSGPYGAYDVMGRGMMGAMAPAAGTGPAA